MKINKTAGKILALALVVSTVALFTACDTGNSPETKIPEERASFGDNTPIKYSRGEIIIRGENLYPSEWDEGALIDKIIAMVEKAATDRSALNDFLRIQKMLNLPIEIIVKETDEFTNFKVITNTDDLQDGEYTIGVLNISVFDNNEKLLQMLDSLLRGMNGNVNFQIGQGLDTSHDTIRMANAPDDHKAIAQSVARQLPQSRIAIHQRALLGKYMNVRGA